MAARGEGSLCLCLQQCTSLASSLAASSEEETGQRCRRPSLVLYKGAREPWVSGGSSNETARPVLMGAEDGLQSQVVVVGATWLSRSRAARANRARRVCGNVKMTVE